MRIFRVTPRPAKLPQRLGAVVGIHVTRSAGRIAEFDRTKKLVRLLELPLGSACEGARRLGPFLRLSAPWGFAVLSTQESLFRHIGDVPEGEHEMLTVQLQELARSMGGAASLVGDISVAIPCGSEQRHGYLAIARETAVRRALELIERAGARPGGVGLEMPALFELWRRADPGICREQIGLAHSDGCGLSLALFDRTLPVGMRHVLLDRKPTSQAAAEEFVKALAADAGWSKQPRALVTGDAERSCGATLIGALALSPSLSESDNVALVQRCLPAIAAALAG